MTKNLAKLSRETVGDLPDVVLRPTYRAEDLTPGIVHIGVGNFHRAHQAWYLHRLMQQGEALDWAIVGAGVRPGDGVMRDKLKAQGYLNTLIELRPDGQSAEVTGPMTDFAEVEPDNAALIAKMADPSIRIVSLTVTEGGYYVDSVTKGFDAEHAEIQHDVANPAQPKTAFGAIVAALGQRRASGAGPFTVQSCDNLQGNGDITRNTVLSLAQLTNPELAAWIEETCSFPNSMVDCIVPATGPAEIASARGFGIEDAAPVTHEFFRQWVIEDDFCAGRPDWDKVGATFTSHVHAYETMKIRILNAGHQVLANVGELLSVPTIADCMAHPTILAFFRKVEQSQIVPTVSAVPEMGPADYADLIERRFANPAIRDTTRRVAFDGSSRHPGFVLPILRDLLDEGHDVAGLALVEALWARMCAGVRDDGTKIEPNDPNWDSLNAAAELAKSDPMAWLNQPGIYGPLAENDAFASAFTGWLRLIWEAGTEGALKVYIDG